MLPMLMHSTLNHSTWDVFCHVVDNLGDVGVCLRLARGLAALGQSVRLFIDDSTALSWMAPQPTSGVTVLPWHEANRVMPGAVVVEAFGCNPPSAFVAAMTGQAPPPLWINVEYLSAEPYVERSHGLPSPQAGGLTKWFFYPGFTLRTGGLLREAGLLQAQTVFDRDAWLAARGAARLAGERVVSLFSYANPALPTLLKRLAEQPTLLLLTAGQAVPDNLQRAMRGWRGLGGLQGFGGLRVQRLPLLSQSEFDKLLWACDLNFVRGEDSLVRAIWAGAPFVWQIYPQHDGAHAVKLQAQLTAAKAPPDVAAFCWAWNGLGTSQGLPPWPDMPGWQAAASAWRGELVQQPDLATQLLAFAKAKTLGQASPGSTPGGTPGRC